MRADYHAQVYFEGEIYPTSAHAYYAAKTIDPNIRRRIMKAPTLSEMYSVAKTLESPEGWDQRKCKLMEKI